MSKKIILILLVFVTSCAGFKPMSPISYSFKKHEKMDEFIPIDFAKSSIILGSFNYRVEIDELNKIKSNGKMGWINTNDSGAVSFMINNDENLANYSLTSGKYYLATLNILPKLSKDCGGKKRKSFITTVKGLKNNNPTLASFEAKDGEIVYIGDLYFTAKAKKDWLNSGTLSLEVLDNYTAAVKELYDKNPELQHINVVKRLAKSGSSIQSGESVGRFW